ncbi:hypothetical protein CSA37_02410 [Candidatus Fermentibacteria bacterium]|nr:MAG: hypothetical protein CSA37_02410 [Candidatus Fermentibacteria bacterium]
MQIQKTIQVKIFVQTPSSGLFFPGGSRAGQKLFQLSSVDLEYVRSSALLITGVPMFDHTSSVTS